MSLIHILDHKTDELLGDSSKYYDDNHYEPINNQETFNFTEPVNSDISSFLSKKNRVIIPVDDGFFREFIITETQQIKDGIMVFTMASYIELKNAEPIAPIKLQGQTINTAMDFVLNGTDWKRGITDYAGTRTVEFDEYIMPYDGLKKLSNVGLFDLELRFRIETKGGKVVARYVDMIKKQGDWKGKEIVSGKDLINAKRIEKTDEVVTGLYGIGPQKEDGSREFVIVTNEEARQVWGRKGDPLWDIYVPQTEDMDMTVERLTTLTETELNKRISAHVSYEIEGVDIEHVMGREHEKVRLGDEARIKATEYNPPIYLDSRIIAIEGPIRDKSQKKYFLGEFVEYTEDDIKANLKLMEKQLAKKIGEAQLVSYAEKIIPEQATAPDPIEHPKWVDTSGNEPVLKLWDENSEEYVATKGEKGEDGAPGPNVVDENTQYGSGYDPSEKATPEEVDQVYSDVEDGLVDLPGPAIVEEVNGNNLGVTLNLQGGIPQYMSPGLTNVFGFHGSGVNFTVHETYLGQQLPNFYGFLIFDFIYTDNSQRYLKINGSGGVFRLDDTGQPANTAAGFIGVQIVDGSLNELAYQRKSAWLSSGGTGFQFVIDLGEEYFPPRFFYIRFRSEKTSGNGDLASGFRLTSRRLDHKP